MARGANDRYPQAGGPPASAPVVHRDCNPARSTRRVLKISEGEGYHLTFSGVYGGRLGSYQAQVLDGRRPAFDRTPEKVLRCLRLPGAG